MKKVCHLTSVHPPFDIRIFHKECKTLCQAGYQVVLIAPHDQDEEVDGVRIRALRKAKSRFKRMTQTVWGAYKESINQEADTFHFHDIELLPVGLLLKLRGKRVIYDVHEDYSQALLSREWIPSWLRHMVSRMVVCGEWLGAKYFDGVVVATPHIARRFPTMKTVTVQNFPFLNQSIRNPIIPYQQREKIVAYVGVVSALRGAKEMVKAMALLPDRLDVRLKIAGIFSPGGLEGEVKNLPGGDWVDFLGWQRHKETMAMLGEARIGLVVFRPVPNHTEAQPNKLFEYMSAGIPVIASDFLLWRRIVGETQCGLLVDPLNPKAIAEAIQWLLEHPAEAEVMGKRGQKAIREHYNWDVEAQKLLTLYERILGQR
ncbi:MAG: glycosyltransferase family 4 protein [Deltaproteobacteria bacterium]|nr:glycosyltransferase family 4 protein [Deltaproteobacteria bacterium]